MEKKKAVLGMRSGCFITVSAWVGQNYILTLYPRYYQIFLLALIFCDESIIPVRFPLCYSVLHVNMCLSLPMRWNQS